MSWLKSLTWNSTIGKDNLCWQQIRGCLGLEEVGMNAKGTKRTFGDNGELLHADGVGITWLAKRQTEYLKWLIPLYANYVWTKLITHIKTLFRGENPWNTLFLKMFIVPSGRLVSNLWYSYKESQKRLGLLSHFINYRVEGKQAIQ